MNLIKCNICLEEKSDTSFGMHLKHKHSMSSKEYYDKFLKDVNEGICPVCKKETKFLGITKKYRKYCSKKCSANDIELKKKREETNLKKYGVKCNLSSKENREKQYKTCEEKYGNKHPQKTNIIKDNCKKRCIEKYGVSSYFKSDRFKEKSIETYLLKSDGKYTHNSQFKETQNKRKESFKLKYDQWNYNYKNTCIERYGVENPMQISEIRAKSQSKYMYNMTNFDSSAELAYYIWLKENNIKFEYQPNIKFEYEYNGKKHIYCPDFLIKNEYIEIKGNHFFENGKMVNPYDRTQDDKYEAKHQCMLKNNVRIITDYNIYITYVNEKYDNYYLSKFKISNIDEIYNNLGDFPFPENGIINKFHKSIWKANRFNHISPFDAWNDKKLIKKVISNRLIYQEAPYTHEKIRQGLNVTKLAPKVSVFKPNLAKRLIQTHLNEYNEVFDPFSGFSGRMLGACSLGKKYIGQDLNKTHIEESIQIKEYLNLNADLECKDIFDSKGKYECLFTCSPYNLKEVWNENETNLSCDEWIDICLSRFECEKYMFVVDKTEKYKEFIVETLENKSHFGKNNEYVVILYK